jgi:hypothetical protein
MALLFIDGFDHYATADLAKKWNNAVGGFIAANGRRTSGNFQNVSGTGTTQGYVSKTLPASLATGVIGFALYVNALPGSDTQGMFLSFGDSGVFHAHIGVDASGNLYAARASAFGSISAVLGRSSGGPISGGAYNFVEVKATINDTTGAVTIKLNGTVVLTLTSQDTRNAGNASFNQVYIGQFQASGGMHIRIDDLYVCDTSGSVNNDFLGDCRIDTLFPTGDGASSAFTPSTGTTHWSLVDEATPNTSDYVDGVSVGDRDLYTYPALVTLSTSTVFGMQVNAMANKDDAGARSLALTARSSSTNVDGTSQAMSTSQVNLASIFETDSASAAWTQTTVNAGQFGVKVAA